MDKIISSFDGLLLHYNVHKSQGIRSQKPCIVLIHGAGGNISAWKRFREAWHAKGFNTLAINLRGHGRSKKPLHKKSYSLEYFARDINEIVKVEKVVDPIIIGHSFGCCVLSQLVKKYPKLTKKYVLITPPLKLPLLLKFLSQFFRTLLYDFLFFKPRQKPRLYSTSDDYKHLLMARDIHIPRLIQDIKRTTLFGWLNTYCTLASFNGNKEYSHFFEDTLVIRCTKDKYVSKKDVLKISSLIKQSTLITIPKEYHVIVLNNPEKLFGVISRHLMNKKFI